jgi:putative ABC transport system ATP-binding protein
MSEIILEARNINRYYQVGDHNLHVLKDVSFKIERGMTAAIVGPSGSGKSTCLSLTAGLDEPSEGEIFLCGQSLQNINENERAALRSREVGFIFQSFQLLSTLTALENVMVPMELQGKSCKETKDRAKMLLKEVGLEERLDHYPAQLSGGEQQRVAIARAFVNKPSILFADEPTGNLDTATGKSIQESLFKMNKQFGTTLILVTHDNELAAKMQKVIRLKAGRVCSE